MTPLATKPPKPTRAEVAEARRRRFRAKHSTPAQRKLMAAGDPMTAIREKFSSRIVQHCHHRCFLCGRFLGSGGGCPGVKQSNPLGTPVCWETAKATAKR